MILLIEFKFMNAPGYLLLVWISGIESGHAGTAAVDWPALVTQKQNRHRPKPMAITIKSLV
ncbi:MAG TPA: hypothetical protein VHS34_07500 [Terriglobales bacterium]|nr:hypothetical protein [Terriglobales bacterium]